jgi:hypothetical protein
MLFTEAMAKAEEVIRRAGLEPKDFDRSDFLKFGPQVIYAVSEIPKRQRDLIPWLPEFLVAWKTLYDDFEELCAKDPMINYQPQNAKALAFHQSLAKIRYFRGSNRSSKTTSGLAEIYWAMTGVHPYRPMDPGQASCFTITGMSFTGYKVGTWEKKMFTGEDSSKDRSPITPMFPDGGRWFHYYDPRNYTLTISCRKCAEAGKPKECPGHHIKPTYTLASAEQGVTRIESFTARVAHLDEHVPEEFYNASLPRLADQRGYMVVTGTPYMGPQTWETKTLARIAEGPERANKVNVDNPNSPPMVFMVTCGAVEGNIMHPDEIVAMRQSMDEFEAAARLDGIPSTLAKNNVFDRDKLSIIQKRMNERKLDGVRGDLTIKDQTMELEDLVRHKELIFEDHAEGKIIIWEQPSKESNYIISVDSAQGLDVRTRDPSVADVWKYDPSGPRLFQVAQLHGWINPEEFADEIKKLGVWYNRAILVIENNGPGAGVIKRLKHHLYYWNIFQDTREGQAVKDGGASQFGINTNAQSKPAMVGVAQKAIHDLRMEFNCQDSINELLAFNQETHTASGLVLAQPRFRGTSGAHDDRTMAAIMAAYVANTFPVADFFEPTHDMYEKNEHLTDEERRFRAVAVAQRERYLYPERYLI